MSDKTITSFRIGERYTHEEVYQTLEIGNAGGIRPCVDDRGLLRRLVIMTSAPSARILGENPYHDRVEGDVLVYTAAGREGDQSVGGANRRIPSQLSTPFPIYGFSNIAHRRNSPHGKRRWEFLGLLRYARHYPETQVDARQKLRHAWVFEMLIHRLPDIIPVAHDTAVSSELLAGSAGDATDDMEVVRAASVGDEAPKQAPSFDVEQLRRRLLSMQPREFELLVRNMLESSGFINVAVTRYSQDGGIDVNAFAGSALWPVKHLHLQVQAKRWRHTVGRREVAELRGSLRPLARGAIVTTSYFSRGALTESQADGKSPIVLVDGSNFACLVGDNEHAFRRLAEA